HCRAPSFPTRRSSDLRRSWTRLWPRSQRTGGEIMKFSGVLIGSENPAQLKDYYTKLFGKPTWDDNTYFGWQFGDAGIAIGPHDEDRKSTRLNSSHGSI